MKKTIMCILSISAIILSGCGTYEPTDISAKNSNETQTFSYTTTTTQKESTGKVIQLSEESLDDYTFLGRCNDNDAWYEAEITNEEVKQQLWKILREHQKQVTYGETQKIGTNDGTLVLTNKQTKDFISISFDIFCSPPEDGGPEIMSFYDSHNNTGINYGVIHNWDDEKYNGETLRTLISQEIVKTENITNYIKQKEYKDSGSIFFICQYTNWAWGYQNSGFFIDSMGSVYEYDFSNIKDEITCDDQDKMLQALYDILWDPECTPSNQISSKTIEKTYMELILKIDDNPTYKSELAAYDAGQRTYYAVKDDFSIVKICSFGDDEITSSDKNAMKMYKYIIDEMQNN